MDTMYVFFYMLFINGVAGQTLSPSDQSDAFGSKQLEKSEESHRVSSLNLFIFVSLLILTVLTSWLFKHHRFRFVHETGLAVIYGLVVGALIRYTTKPSKKLKVNFTTNIQEIPNVVLLHVPTNGSGSSFDYFEYDYARERTDKSAEENELEEMATFDPEIFFNVLLPPIIFYAGYSLKRKHFFKNFGAIVTYAFLGTFISSMVVGGITYAFSLLMPSLQLTFFDCLWFGSIISATDPVTILAIFSDLKVDMDLYVLVFGESVLNDAVAIILSGTVEKFSDGNGFGAKEVGLAILDFLKVFFGAFFLGSGMGMVTALITKFTHIRDYPLLETSLFFLMSYGTFLAAEAAGVTGIVAVLFCGVCQAHYTYNNLSRESQFRTTQVFELLNFLSESFVFSYVGITTFTFVHHYWHAGFIAVALLAMLISRACNVYPLTFLLNLGRSNKIRYNFQHMMMFAGLRGAIAFALAIRTTDTKAERLIFSTTLIIVITTVILFGGLTTPVLEFLKIRVGVDDDATELRRFTPVGQNVRSYNSTATTSDVMSPQHSSNPVTVTNEDPNNVPSTTDAPVSRSSSQTRPPPQLRLGGKALLVKQWYKIDALFLKPLLTNAKPALTETLPACCLPLSKLLTSEEQYRQESGVSRRAGGDSDDEELIIDEELAYSQHDEQSGGAVASNNSTAPAPLLRFLSEESLKDALFA